MPPPSKQPSSIIRASSNSAAACGPGASSNSLPAGGRQTFGSGAVALLLNSNWSSSPSCACCWPPELEGDLLRGLPCCTPGRGRVGGGGVGSGWLMSAEVSCCEPPARSLPMAADQFETSFESSAGSACPAADLLCMPSGSAAVALVPPAALEALKDCQTDDRLFCSANCRALVERLLDINSTMICRPGITA